MSSLVSAAVLITVAYARPFVHYAQFEWQETWLDGAYTHAWLAIAVLAWLVYRAGGQDFRLRQARASWTAWGLLGLGAATKCAAVLLGHATLDGLSLVPLLLGLSGVLLPDEAARRLRFPILFLLAIVPVPNLVIDLLTGPMRGWQASGVASLFQVAGVPVTRAGYSLLLGDGAGIQARLVLAVHEVAANVIEHAYAGAARQHLTVTIDITPARVTARVDHAGTPLDPTTLTPPVFDGTRSRGFGLWLASRACSDVTFASDDANRHSVILTIHLTNKAAS